MVNEEQVENLGLLIDTCDNYLALASNPYMPITMKADALKVGLENIKNRLREVYDALGGEDVWSQTARPRRRRGESGEQTETA